MRQPLFLSASKGFLEMDRAFCLRKFQVSERPSPWSSSSKIIELILHKSIVLEKTLRNRSDWTITGASKGSKSPKLRKKFHRFSLFNSIVAGKNLQRFFQTLILASEHLIRLSVSKAILSSPPKYAPIASKIILRHKLRGRFFIDNHPPKPSIRVGLLCLASFHFSNNK